MKPCIDFRLQPWEPGNLLITTLSGGWLGLGADEGRGKLR